MEKIQVLLVDDESPARERLKKLLSVSGDVEVVGEAADGSEAIRLIEELQPDLVFLDIQMPGVGGLEVAASLPTRKPTIIFCTAYDQYAVDAFELNAIDYLLKPVSRTRLKAALDKVRQEAESPQQPTLPGGAPKRFLAKRGGRYRVVPARDVLYFWSEEGLTKLVSRESEFWMQPTLVELEQRLEAAAFFRVSRSALVNLMAVKEVVPLVGGYGEVVLANGKRLDVSRRRFKELLEQLSVL